MPLNIDLNVSCNESHLNGTTSVMIDCNIIPHIDDFSSNKNRASPIESYPSSIDLNVYPSHEEEVTVNESQTSLSYDDINTSVVDAAAAAAAADNAAANADDAAAADDADADTDTYMDDLCLEPYMDDLCFEEFDAMLNGTQHDPNNGGVEEDTNTFSEDENGIEPSQKKRTFLDNYQREMVAKLLENSSYNGKLNRGTARWVASLYSVSIHVIWRIWRQFKQTGDARHKKTKYCGRKRVEIDIQKVRDVPLSKRSTLRSLACALGISKTALFKFLRDGVLRRHSNGLKPYMKDGNKIARLRFCLSMLQESSIPHDPEFKPMYNVVHIDEKWFYMTKKSTKYYLLADENDPYRTCKNKNFIGKVMFLAAVARPRFDGEGNELFSGKIGVFPLVTQVPAKRSSVNRVSGTLETKPIASITKEVSRMFLINKVLPAIKEKWPHEHARETIYVQQDNAPSHILVDDEEFCRVACEGGFDIRLINQPPNSPDLNVLDLGFFSAIQSLQHKEATRSVDELIEAVEKSYDAFSVKESNKIFLTLQSCMIELMKVQGCNQYKIPHMKKDAMTTQGILPTQLKCDPELVQQTFAYLNQLLAKQVTWIMLQKLCRKILQQVLCLKVYPKLD